MFWEHTRALVGLQAEASSSLRPPAVAQSQFGPSAPQTATLLCWSVQCNLEALTSARPLSSEAVGDPTNNRWHLGRQGSLWGQGEGAQNQIIH